MHANLNTIKLYGIQDETTYEATQADAIWQRCGAPHATRWLADEWMRRELTERVGASPAPDEACWPVMLHWRKPGMRAKYGEKGDVIYRLTFHVRRGDVVLCDRAGYESACVGEHLGGSEAAERFAESLRRGGYALEDVLDPAQDAPALWALREALFESWAHLIEEDAERYGDRDIVAFCWRLSWNDMRRVERYVMR